ncbi:MAG TPA: hypothetical protein VHP30_01045, partial [Ignavibacteriales bacterium]|nr:hypothetical protein [Ignavibacteriales bacterium]
LVEETEKVERIDINGRIILQPELLMAGNSDPVLWVMTEEQYPNTAYDLEIYSKLIGRSLDVYVSCVKYYPESPSMGMVSPAAARVDLRTFSGEYELTIRSKNFADKYKLIVREDSAFIEGDSTAYTKPVNTMWIR